MHTSSPTLPADRIGRTAADRAGRAAAGALAALAAAAGPRTGLDTIVVAVLSGHLHPTTADDETAAVVRAVLHERDRLYRETMRDLADERRRDLR